MSAQKEHVENDTWNHGKKVLDSFGIGRLVGFLSAGTCRPYPEIRSEICTMIEFRVMLAYKSWSKRPVEPAIWATLIADVRLSHGHLGFVWSKCGFILEFWK